MNPVTNHDRKITPASKNMYGNGFLLIHLKRRTDRDLLITG